jgi:hypothetical protein
MMVSKYAQKVIFAELIIFFISLYFGYLFSTRLGYDFLIAVLVIFSVVSIPIVVIGYKNSDIELFLI